MNEQTWHVNENSRAWGRPWQQLIKLHDALPPGSWTLAGGLMVRVHAQRAGTADTRTTRDVDAVLHVETGSVTYPQAAAALTQLGYHHQIPMGEGPTHRFTRNDSEHVDLMVADHLGPHHSPLFRQRRIMAVPGATNVLRYHTVNCVVRRENPQHPTITFSLPDTLGALSLKGGAYLADNRDRKRHLEDGAVLLSTVDDPGELRGRMQGSDARRVRALVRGIKQERVTRLFSAEQARRIEQVGEALAQGRIAMLADRWKKPSPMPASQRTGGGPTSSAGLCGHPTASGVPCRNRYRSCPHHR